MNERIPGSSTLRTLHVKTEATSRHKPFEWEGAVEKPAWHYFTFSFWKPATIASLNARWGWGMMSWSDMREGDVLWVSFGTFCSSALWGGNKKKKRWGQCTEEQKKTGGKQWHQPSTLTLPSKPINEPISAALQGSESETDENTFFSPSSAAFSSSVAQAAWQSIAMRSGPQLTRNSAKTTLCFFASQSAGMPVKILMWPADSVYLELPQRARCQRASERARSSTPLHLLADASP